MDAGYKHIVGNCINVLITGVLISDIYCNWKTGSTASGVSSLKKVKNPCFDWSIISTANEFDTGIFM